MLRGNSNRRIVTMNCRPDRLKERVTQFEDLVGDSLVPLGMTEAKLSLGGLHKYARCGPTRQNAAGKPIF